MSYWLVLASRSLMKGNIVDSLPYFLYIYILFIEALNHQVRQLAHDLADNMSL